jgi:hypothetical protein
VTITFFPPRVHRFLARRSCSCEHLARCGRLRIRANRAHDCAENDNDVCGIADRKSSCHSRCLLICSSRSFDPLCPFVFQRRGTSDVHQRRPRKRHISMDEDKSSLYRALADEKALRRRNARDFAATCFPAICFPSDVALRDPRRGFTLALSPRAD